MQQGFDHRHCGNCTGGVLAALLTDIEGAGHGFERGFVTYAKDAKTDLLGVERQLVEENDAVTEKVARAMAKGALSASCILRLSAATARPGIEAILGEAE